MTAAPAFQRPCQPFMRAEAADPATLSAAACVFAAPHGTAYDGTDNRVHAGTADALRAAIAPDAALLDSWDYDLGGPVMAGAEFGLADLGDLATSARDGPGNRAAIERATRMILDRGAVPLMIGGDDSVPIPFLAGFADRAKLTLLQIDAHIDWRDERFGERWGFSSTMRRASEMTHVARMVQVGMRGLGSARAGEIDAAAAWGSRIVPARVLHAQGVAAAMEHIEAGAQVVICLDVDALDSSIMPAVAYPTPGGLTYVQVLDLIAGVTAKARLAGFSLVEFVPGRDPTGQAAFVAGRILWNVVGRLARAA